MPATTPSISHCWRASLGIPEEQRVHHRDGPRPHGEDVPEDPPDPGGRPLVGLDGRGVVVALDADGHGDPVAGVDDPGVLPRTDQHMGSLGGQPPEVDPGRLVGAVLAPHHREQGQLEMVGGTPEDGLHLVAFPVGEAERPVEVVVVPGHPVSAVISTRVHGPERTCRPPRLRADRARGRRAPPGRRPGPHRAKWSMESGRMDPETRSAFTEITRPLFPDMTASRSSRIALSAPRTRPCAAGSDRPFAIYGLVWDAQ